MADEVGLSVGDRAPEFTGTLVYPDGDSEDVALADLLEDSAVLLSFYTADFTPDCIDEWCGFRDFEWFAASDDIQVVGVSRSGEQLHRRFIDYLDLGFPLFSDPDLTIAERFDVKYRAFGVNARSYRSCFLVDQEGTVRYRWVADHWLDPTLTSPPVKEIYEGVTAALKGEA